LMKHRNSLGEESSLLQPCLDQKIRENRREQRGPARTGSSSLSRGEPEDPKNSEM
jgi:hypothetical protein